MKEDKGGLTRRDIIKGLAALPVLGGFAIGASSKRSHDRELKESILKELNIEATAPPSSGPMSGDPVRIGIIGFGIRGKQLARAAGFATKEWIATMNENAQTNKNDTRLKDFLGQEDLNIRISGVCDLFDVRAEEAIDSFSTEGFIPKRFRHYSDMIASPDIDAVIIATADHWHAPIAIDAAKAGKHVYIEKPMTHTLSETYELYNTVRASNIVFQLGHQHRQTQSFLTAQDIIKKNVLGHISLVQTNTNRNDDNGAWQYTIHEKANEQTIDWEQFVSNRGPVPFNKEHFFRWRKWWTYGSGLTGDLMTHDYDRINTIMKIGIPKYALTSGGIYTHRDGRNVPDVIQVSLEFPEYTSGTSQESGKEKGLTFLYSATLGNGFNRPSILMGHDATMELGNQLTIHAERRSTRYQEMIENEVLDPEVPLYSYDPSSKGGVDGVTSATAKYFANRGLMYTYRDGKRVDSTFLHIREWLSCIRNGGTPSCNIEQGFQEAITALMSTISYKLGKRVEWDSEKNEIVNPDGDDFDQALTV